MERRALLRGAGGWALAGFGAAALSACARSEPVQNVEGASFQGRAPLRQRAEQIKRAGAGLGWVMQDVYPGLIRGTLNLRTHQAVVDIPYDARRFSIRHVSSSSLDYDGQIIHRNHNSWVQNLQNAIVAQPKTATDASSSRPVCREGGRSMSTAETASAPSSKDDVSQP